MRPGRGAKHWAELAARSGAASSHWATTPFLPDMLLSDGGVTPAGLRGVAYPAVGR